MNSVTLKEAKRNLERLVEQVLASGEPTVVVTKEGKRVVLLPLDEYNSWKETAYLLSSPANAQHLRQSLAEARAGEEAQVSAGARRRLARLYGKLPEAKAPGRRRESRD
jgi:antitoxin YefM